MAEEEAVARFEVAPHALRAHDEAADEPREPVEHVVECEKGVRDDDSLGRGVGDVPLVPERHVLEPDDRSAADDSSEAADALRDDRVALVRHRGRPLLAAAERLFDLAHLRPGQVADLERELLERGGGNRESREELGMAVALEDLGRGRRRLEPESLAGVPFHLRVGCRVGADGARQFSDPKTFERSFDSVTIPCELERPACELEPEGRGLCVDAVRASHHQRVAVLLRRAGRRQ